MKKLIINFLLIIFILLTTLLTILSTIGIETNKFNKFISDKTKGANSVGSGMTNAEANQILNWVENLPQIEKAKIDDILASAKKINDNIIQDINNIKCLIIDSFENNIDEKLLYSILNQSKLTENYVLINSIPPLKKINFNLEDLRSRINSFLYIGIDLPTDDLLKVIITKTLSDKQISINPKLSDYIINNVERSYEKLIKFLKDLDEMSLSTGKSININLIKKALNK